MSHSGSSFLLKFSLWKLHNRLIIDDDQGKIKVLTTLVNQYLIIAGFEIEIVYIWRLQ